MTCLARTLEGLTGQPIAEDARQHGLGPLFSSRFTQCSPELHPSITDI